MYNKKIVYIGGTGRCGTNVLKELMSSSPNAAALPFETRFPIDPDGLVSLYNGLCHRSFYGENISIKRFCRFMDRVSKRSLLDIFTLWVERQLKRFGFQANIRPYAGWELEKHFTNLLKERDRLISAVVRGEFPGYWPGEGIFSGGCFSIPVSNVKEIEQAFSNFLAEVYGEFLDRRNAEFYIDDNTFNLLNADTLAKFSDSSVFVHSIRDPRNVVVSMMEQRWCPSDVDKSIQFYRYLMDRIIENENQLKEETFYRIKIEEVSKESGNNIRSLFVSIGLDFNESQVRSILERQGARTSNDWSSYSPEVKNSLNVGLKPYVEMFGYGFE